MTTVSEHGSRVDVAYEWLLTEITGFRLRAGTPLSENRIAAQLDISRTPVREALQRLEKEGLITRTDNSRFTVAQISRSEVNDACDLLVALDTYIFTRAASRLTEKDARVLLDSVEQMSQAAVSGDRAAWSEADLFFHRTVNEIAGNRLVADTVKETRRRIHRFWLRASTRQNRLESCSAEHRVLTEAMVAGELQEIGPAVEEHIGHMREGILDMIAGAEALLGEY